MTSGLGAIVNQCDHQNTPKNMEISTYRRLCGPERRLSLVARSALGNPDRVVTGLANTAPGSAMFSLDESINSVL